MFTELLHKMSPQWLLRSLHLLARGYGSVVTRDELAARDQMIARNICKRMARGNISLQMGRYVTSSELEARRERNLKYSFAE